MDINSTAKLAVRLLEQYKLIDWKFVWDYSKRRFGQCRYTTKEISLSMRLTALNSEDHVRDTILHEIAHALVGPGHGHDVVWKAKCIEIGCRPIRCYDKEVRTPEPDYIYRCRNCGHLINRTKRMKDYLSRWHRRCGKDLGKLEKVK